MAEVKKPSDLPKAQKHEVPQNEPGLSSKTLSPLYQSYLSSLDQQPVHKDHRPVPVLRMNTLTTMTSTEMENLAQQYKVHEVMTQEGQCSTQTSML